MHVPSADPAGRDVDADPDAHAAHHVPRRGAAGDAGGQPGRAAAPHHTPPTAVLAGTANHTGKNLELLKMDKHMGVSNRLVIHSLHSQYHPDGANTVVLLSRDFGTGKTK